MSEKFTPGEWFFEGGNEVNTEQKNICRCVRLAMEPGEVEANAHLISAAPDMYRNEKANLHVIKTLLKVYEELQLLFLTDDDVKKALPNMPSWTFEHIITELKNRINETEETLKKARGEA